MTQDATSRQRIQKIETLIHRVEGLADAEARVSTLELVQALMELHGEGINRLLEIVSDDPAGQSIIERLGEEELVSGLLLLYGLHPVELETRVIKALDKVRPYLKSHGGNVALVGIDDGVVRLKMEGTCNGCASSAVTMKLAIEEAIYEVAPDVAELLVEGVVEERKPAMPVPLQITRKQKDSVQVEADGGWEEVVGITSLAQGSAQAIEVNGRQVLFCRLNGDYYAYTCACSNCGETMNGAHLEAEALACPNCGERFDVLRAGRSLDRSDLQLQPFPLLMENGQAKIALPQYVGN
ncbi:MAG: NifU family protein [Acidobacteriota bacterium]|nr:NifU family protein [Acidobacteriota bacterium]